MSQMFPRPGFATPARSFSITLSLKEGYGESGTIHAQEEVLRALRRFAQEQGVEIGGSIRNETIFYSYLSGSDVVWAEEPGVNISGLFPPNKFSGKSDEELVALVGDLVGYLADATGQISVHAEVCGRHYCWKRKNEKTAREAAQQ